ncbi:nucleoside phosphorylase [Arcticibacter pallidicorallinus]|uniref:Nucleoside phosphorylase n=1 Tax=Arcticibacter pallidicorallinus TaxID=1259464 RepID=A0A2T0U3Z5_9SPHI|nr:response regulator [Arcticibacter pallidicorallinus]PRY52620.1 nucleoside phosphorylase [Arcticibacter pallidicorallinus]
MISILIVDDDSSKVADIKQVLYEFPEINNKISVVADTNNARRLLEEYKYDLLILDLVLPNDFGDEPSPDNGVDFLNEIKLDPNKKCPYHILGVTGKPEHILKYSSDFSKNLWFLIEYQAGVESWKELLRNKIEYLLDSKKDIQFLNLLEHDFDVAIITALDKELKKILALDWKWKEKLLTNDQTSYYIGQFEKGKETIRIVAACTPQMGMCASSTLSMKLIHHFKPKYLIMSGIAAGIKGEVNLGDIMIADEIWDASSGKIKGDKDKGTLFLPDPKHKTLNEDIKELLLRIKRNRKYLDEIRSQYQADAPSTILDMHVGPMTSVPAVIQSDAEITKIRAQSRKLIGLEMEAYGVFYSAAHSPRPKPIAISIKSACDFANEEKADSFQDYAAYTSASFVYELVMNELKF